MKLVNNWKQAWRWFSMNCMIVAGAILTTWATIPDDLRAAVPPKLMAGAVVIVLFLGIFGRLVYQPPKKKKR